MITRLLAPPLSKTSKSVLLLGPRQVGKSTLLESLKPDLIINLAKPSEYLAFTTNPEELESRIELAKPRTVLIDEVQRIPDLLNAVQVLIDGSRGKLKFYLSGSSARKLKRGSANLLPGRVLNYRIGPLSTLELPKPMETKTALELGCLPEPHLMNDRETAEKLLKSYAATYLQEEILAETLIRQVHGFSRFLSVVASNAGKFLDFSKISSKSKVNRSAARRYFEILEDTLICERVDAYESEDQNLVKHSKFYFFDVGIVNALLGNFCASEDRRGLLLEHLFYNQLKNTAYALDIDLKINHYRTRGGAEVDFILTLPHKTIAIEVKSTEPSAGELTTLQGLPKTLGKQTQLFVACGKCHPKKIGPIQVLPWQEVIARVFHK